MKPTHTVTCTRVSTAISVLGIFASAQLSAAEQKPKAPESDYGVLAYIDGIYLNLLELPDGKPKRISRQYEVENLKWSGSGRWLMFKQHASSATAREWRTVVVRRDGSNLREVGSNSEDYQWVGNKDELAFEQKGAIWIAKAPLFKPHWFARMPKERRNQSVSFLVSPNRKHIAFNRHWINWNKAGTDFDEGSGILWVEDSTGKNRRRLYDSHGSWTDLPVFGGWSPDSRYISMGTWVYHAGSGNLDGTPLYVFDVFTGKYRQIAPDEVMKHFDWHAYSADGRKVVVMNGGARWGTGGKNLLVYDSRTWKWQKVTRDEVDSVFPAWSPDARRLAFIENAAIRNRSVDYDLASTKGRLCVMDSDGKDKRMLTKDDGNGDWDPMWCGDGKHILFTRLSKQNDRASFWLIRDDGKELRKLKYGPSIRGNDKWTEQYDFWATGKGWDHR